MVISTGILNILSRYGIVPSDKSKAGLTFEEAEGNKNFASIMPIVLVVKKEVELISDQTGLLRIIHQTAAKLFNKNYFVS